MAAPLTAIEGIEDLVEHGLLVIAQGKQGHAGLQFHVVRIAKDLRRRLVGVFQQQSRAFDEAGAEYRIVQVFVGLLNRCNCELLRQRTAAESRDLGKDKPHPMRCLPARLEFGEDAVIDGLLCKNEVVERVFHASI